MKDETTKAEKPLTIPGEGIPVAVLDMIEKSSKPSQSRALVFENDKQRNLGALRKGLSKPGLISYEVLRRAIAAVPVARICVNVLKQKVTKTKWVIKAVDPLGEVDEHVVKKITKLLKNPNPDDTWREFIDKALEDLLVLDSVAIEKTRFDNGEIAEMYNVDASTIRPVYDEFGNQDVPIALHTVAGNEELPVSYLQIFNNSMYGGPESGEIVGAWSKRDFIFFHMYPQGSMENFGYGLSPLEAVMSVTASLLNADNYNSSYFDEGSFPPIILQLEQPLEQRQLEAYREYLYQELAGEFHRPAIMAGGGEMKVHNLKDMSNTDMQFMEYTEWLAKLMAGAYGLSPQDIGLTDDVNRSTSQTMKELSESKGYGSILDLLKDIINTNIINRDFGLYDIEFDWVMEDATDPDVASQIYDRALKNGTITINEVREKMGELPYEDWADQPLLLTGEGYVPIHFDDRREEEEGAAASSNISEETLSKSMKKSVYTMDGYRCWFDDRGFGQPFICQNILSRDGYVIKPPVAVNLYSQGLEAKLTKQLYDKGLNVHPVVEKTYNELFNIFPTALVAQEFEKYVNMTPEYDSEKWRSKQGGSRKYPYYMYSAYIDGFPLNSRQMIDDMKRAPADYTQAITDLAKLWKAEKDMVLGDRRADQYIITPDKRAYGFDYQFEGDKGRWEDSSTAIAKVLISIPSLYKQFNEQIEEKPKSAKKSIVSKIFG